MKRLLYYIVVSLMLCETVLSCREDELVVPTEYDLLPGGPDTECDPIGMYLLNEGTWAPTKRR